MLEFYCGVPGSGKTYKAVDHVYNSFLDDKNSFYGKYERFYTNINEFNYEFFNNPDSRSSSSEKVNISFFSSLKFFSNKDSSKNQFAKVRAEKIVNPTHFIDSAKRELKTNDSALDSDDDIAIELDIDQLLIDLEELRQLYLQKVSDAVLLNRASELKLSDSLFIIDEAHNFFDAKNDVLIWWLSYHRHLHQDIMLITQSFDLIFRRYLKFSEFYYQAVPSSLRVRGGVFTYNQYIKWQLFKNSKVDSIKIKFNPAVYALYGSGANTQGKKVIYKFIMIGLIALFIAFLGLFFFTSSLSQSDSNSTSSSDSISSQVSIDRSKSFTVVCVGFECSFMGQNISLNDLNRYSKEYQLQPIKTSAIGEGVFLRTFASNDKFLSEVLNVQIDSSSDR